MPEEPIERIDSSVMLPEFGADVYNSANLPIPSGVLTALTFNSERYDNGGLHSTVANTSRVTVARAGKYAITGHVVFAANGTGVRAVSVYVNGTTGITTAGGLGYTGDGNRYNVSRVVHLAAGDYVEIYVYQTSGGNLDVVAEQNWSPELVVEWMGQ